MAKPQINKITSIDALFDYEITFSWYGNRIKEHTIYVYNNDSGALVYESTVETYSLTHLIPANTLENGNKYYVRVKVKDVNNEISALSDAIVFPCIKTPVLYFANPTSGETITSNVINASVTYYSEQNEQLRYYTFYLYNSNKKLVYKTDEKYDIDNIAYAYTGLENETTYFLKCEGYTAHSIHVETDYIEVRVSYKKQSFYSQVYAINEPKYGMIHVTSNFIFIKYTGKEKFEFKDGRINLTNKEIYYDEGFLIQDSFTVQIDVDHMRPNEEILYIKGEGGDELRVTTFQYPSGKIRFKLLTTNGVTTCLLYSNELNYSINKKYSVAVRKDGDFYDLQAFEKGDT